MTERDAFLQAIIENPDDDAPRLIFADWLDEHGEPERAEFIRLQCQLHNAPHGKQNKDMGYREWGRLDAREHELIKNHTGEINQDRYWLPKISGIHLSLLYCKFSRGFVAEVTLPCRHWLTCREALLRATPLERVTLTHVAVGGVRRENDTLVCPVFRWQHSALSLPLQVRQGQLWYWMELDRDGKSSGVHVFAVDGDIPFPLWDTIEDSFRAHWDREVEDRYARDIANGFLTRKQARQLMRRELLSDFST